MDLSVYKRTVGARINLAFAAANGQAPPRPCPFRKLNKYNCRVIMDRPFGFVLSVFFCIR